MKIVNKNDVASAVGYEAEPGEWFTVTQDNVNQFADCTFDQQFIHVDPEKG